jgi:hypothetical protein
MPVHFWGAESVVRDGPLRLDIENQKILEAIRKANQVLSIGGGISTLTRSLATACGDVTVVEMPEDHVQEAPTPVEPGIKILHEHWEKLPFGGRGFASRRWGDSSRSPRGGLMDRLLNLDVQKIHAALCQGITHGAPGMEEAFEALANLANQLDMAEAKAMAYGAQIRQCETLLKEVKADVSLQHQAANQFRLLLERATGTS